MQMSTIKDRNGMDLREAEDLKKRWQEHTEELWTEVHNIVQKRRDQDHPQEK